MRAADMKKILFTAIFNYYDELAPINQPGWDCICFTDNPDMTAQGWRIVRMEPYDKIFRHIKTCPHLFLPNHDLSVWIDGNLTPKISLDQIAKGKTDYTLMQHPERKCLYREAERCIQLGKDDAATINAQMERYRRDKYPAKNGLVATGVIIRPGSAYERFGEAWWDEIRDGSVRDQLSFNYVAWRHKLRFAMFPFLQGFDKVIHASKRRETA